VVDGQVDRPARPAELVAEPLDRQPDGRRVDDGQHLGDVLRQQPVEEHLVAVTQVRQVDPTAQVGGLGLVLRVHPPELAVEGRDAGGQQPDEPELVALLVRERGAPVDGRRGEHRRSPRANAGDDPLGGVYELVGVLGHVLPSRGGHFLVFFGM
jgi:hypothetical protein